MQKNCNLSEHKQVRNKLAQRREMSVIFKEDEVQYMHCT